MGIRAWGARGGAPQEVDIGFEKLGAPEENESRLAIPVEGALRGSPGLVEIRTESTAAGVQVRALFDGKAKIDDAKVDERLLGLGPAFPSPHVAPVTPRETIFVRSATSLEDAIGRDSEIVGHEACSEPTTNVIVRLDAQRLASFGIEIASVLSLLEPIAKGSAAPSASPPDAQALGGKPVRVENGVTVKLSDVAHVTTQEIPSPCRVVGATDHVYALQVPRGSSEGHAQARRLAPGALFEDDAVRVVVRLAPGAPAQRQAELLSSLVTHIASPPGLTLFAALLHDDDRAELVYSASKEATPESLKPVRDAVKKTPGLSWAGASGALMTHTRRLVVRVADPDLEALEHKADDVRKIVDALPEVVSSVSGPPSKHLALRFVPRAHPPQEMTPELVKKLTDLALAPHGLIIDENLRVALGRPGLEALNDFVVQRAPFGSYGSLHWEYEPTIVRVDGQRAQELEWEVTDASGVLDRVTKTLAGRGIASLK